MEDMKNKIEDDDWIQVESGQWHQLIIAKTLVF